MLQDDTSLLSLQDDASLRSYFDSWRSEFGQSFQPGTAEYERALAIFKSALQVGLHCLEHECTCDSTTVPT